MQEYIKYRKACRRLKKQEKEIERQVREINSKDPNWDDGLDPVEISVIAALEHLKNLKQEPASLLAYSQWLRYR